MNRLTDADLPVRFLVPKEADCPGFIDHTPSPPGYLEWHEWAKKMGRTHRQIKCAGCGLYKIWVPRAGRNGLAQEGGRSDG